MMKTTLKFVKAYWLSTLAYIIYLVLLISQIRAQQNFRETVNNVKDGGRLPWGEGIMYGELLMFLIGAGSVFLCLLIAFTSKERRKHFVILGFLFLIPTSYFIATL
jgi:hypothetical protein